MTTTIDLKIADGVARVTFQNERGIHTLGVETREQLFSALDVITDDASVRVVVFQSEGRTYIAGADIKELKMLSFTTAEETSKEGHKLMNRVQNLSAVTVAAIHASCAGGGTELALSCDLRYASDEARIGLPEIRLGIIPGWGGTVRATRMFGPAVAKQMILPGDLMPAEKALRLGIIDEVFPMSEFRAGIDASVRNLLNAGPDASRIVKQTIADLCGCQTADFAHEAAMFAKCFADGQATEGTEAFLNKRPANWVPDDGA